MKQQTDHIVDSNKKMTAVEWLIEQLYSHSGHIDVLDVANLNGYFEQAKQMEKEQKKQIVIHTYVELKMKNHNLPYGMEYINKLAKVEQEAEKYYNETYGK